MVGFPFGGVRKKQDGQEKFLETTFSISINDGDLVIENFDTIERITTYIEDKLTTDVQPTITVH